MKIIIDTNLLRQDFLLHSRKFEMLHDFLSKSDYEIVLPRIVFDEICSLYKCKLINIYGKLVDSIKSLNKLFIESSSIDIPDLDTEKLLDNFVENMRKRIFLKDKNIIPLNNKHLPFIVERAINKLPPFFDNKSEFRDALIWLATLEVASSEPRNAVIFLSSNTKEFSDNSGNLHPVLLEQANQIGVEIQYFTSIDKFLQSKASNICFITLEWLRNNIDFKALDREITLIVELNNQARLSDLAEREHAGFCEISEVVSCPNIEICDFYVYEMKDTSLRVEVQLKVELEVEYSTQDVYTLSDEHEHIYFPETEEYEFIPVKRRELTVEGECKYFYPTATIDLHLIVKDETIVSSEIVGTYL